ncbi:MAG TPA: cupredoxin domain-containing protein [Acidimicrobiales bacterium]|nr:cupredoxin domain-containing protein [Acidimicrobiales bacterium]
MKKLVAIGAVGLFALMGCGSDKTEKVTINAAPVNGKPGFAPEVISVRKGDKVDIEVGNTTDKTHGFAIQGYGLEQKTVDPGKPVHIKFTAKKSGTYEIKCQLHPAHQSATFQVD